MLFCGFIKDKAIINEGQNYDSNRRFKPKEHRYHKRFSQKQYLRFFLKTPSNLERHFYFVTRK